MDRERLDGIIVADPVNVYHMTGFWPATSRMGYDSPVIAMLTRDPQRPIAFVSAEFTWYYLLSDNGYRYPFETFLFLDTPDPERSASHWGSGPSRVFEDAALEPLSKRERDRRAAVRSAANRQAPGSDREAAILNAMRWAGLDRGRVAVDRDDLRAVFAKATLPAEVVDAGTALKWIRLVKSPAEIVLARRAAEANAAAAMAATTAAREGATYRELRTTFAAEAARRGNRSVFMVIDGVSAEGVDMPFRDGQAFMIDAVSEGAGYHGDFARTVLVGEPSPSMQAATDAIRLGWAEVRSALRPGLRFSDITRLGRDTVKKSGYDFFVMFGPHSVGLHHNDAIGLGDLMLEENMVLSVDCPVMQAGIGGTAHLEDLMLITRDGAEPLHTVTDSIIRI